MTGYQRDLPARSGPNEDRVLSLRDPTAQCCAPFIHRSLGPPTHPRHKEQATLAPLKRSGCRWAHTLGPLCIGMKSPDRVGQAALCSLEKGAGHTSTRPLSRFHEGLRSGWKPARCVRAPTHLAPTQERPARPAPPVV